MVKLFKKGFYITSDLIGKNSTGAGTVTKNECLAFSEICDSVTIFDKSVFQANSRSFFMNVQPWTDDYFLIHALNSLSSDLLPEIAHVYSGCFPLTVNFLKSKGVIVTHTAAAHSIEKSFNAHLMEGFEFPYPHLIINPILMFYLDGYKKADLVITPSKSSKEIMLNFNCKNISVIPHGIDYYKINSKKVNNNKTFILGYLGSYSPDKGVKNLLKAWSELKLSNSVLILGGYDSRSEYVTNLLQKFNIVNCIQKGYVEEITDFYEILNVYVQPSITEGFGIEVIEALLNGCLVICSDGAGASDVVNSNFVYKFDNIEKLKELIEKSYYYFINNKIDSIYQNSLVQNYDWKIIRESYKQNWRKLWESQKDHK